VIFSICTPFHLRFLHAFKQNLISAAVKTGGRKLTLAKNMV
jgi:hypothetical protein